jgi:hypothetical protein
VFKSEVCTQQGGAGMEFSFVEKRNKLTFSWMLLLLRAFSTRMHAGGGAATKCV